MAFNPDTSSTSINSSLSERKFIPDHEDPIDRRMQELLRSKRSREKQATSRLGIGIGKSMVKIKPRARPGENVLLEINRLQKSHQLLIPRMPFHRLVREISQNLAPENDPQNPGNSPGLRFQTAALEALQEAAESYLTQLFEDSFLCTRHAGRVTLFAKDIHLCQRLQQPRYLFPN